MSSTLTSLCSVLLKEHFGETVQKVGTFLMKHVSSCPLFLIARKISLPIQTVKVSLRVLIQHGLCTFSQGEKGIVEYKVKHENVLVLLHYERYACYAQMLCGDFADVLVMEILNNGFLTMSETLRNVLERLQDSKDSPEVGNLLKTIQDKFVQLVERHFLIRCLYPHPSNTIWMPNLSISEHELFLVPQIQLGLLGSCLTEEPSAKKQKVEYPDKGKYWKINHDKYIEYFRNESIINACSNQMGEKAAEIVKIILTLSENKSNLLSPTTNPVSRYEVVNKIPQAAGIKPEEVDSYLSLLCEGSHSFISKADDRSEGMYVVNVAKVLRRLVESTVANAVRDRFGSNCAKIFRILLAKKVLEPKPIEKLSMIQPKEAIEHVYRLFEESFIVSHEVSKGSDFSHGQMIYLFYVDLVQVCHMLLEHCYKALHSLFIVSELQTEENRRLLERKQRVDAIVLSLRQNAEQNAEQIQEVLNMITPPEEAVIKKVTICSEKLDNGKMQVADNVLLLAIFLEFSRCH